MSHINQIRYNSVAFTIQRLVENENEHYRNVLKIDKKTGSTTFYAYSDPEDVVSKNAEPFLEIDAEAKELTLKRDKRDIKMSKLELPVGSLVPSFLTLEIFQRLYGNHWVLCDGSECKGSLFAELTGWENLPDLSGKFLRNAGGDAAELGETQKDSTKLGALAKSFYYAYPQRYFSTHKKIENALRPGEFVGLDESGVKDIKATPIGEKNIGNDTGETRPVNITANYFIRIN